MYNVNEKTIKQIKTSPKRGINNETIFLTLFNRAETYALLFKSNETIFVQKEQRIPRFKAKKKPNSPTKPVKRSVWHFCESDNKYSIEEKACNDQNKNYVSWKSGTGFVQKKTVFIILDKEVKTFGKGNFQRPGTGISFNINSQSYSEFFYCSAANEPNNNSSCE